MAPLTPPVALTMGEPAGIGGELTLMAWIQAHQGLRTGVFFVIDDPTRLQALAARLGWDVPIATIGSPQQAAAIFPSALPVLPLSLPRPVAPGCPDPANADCVARSIAWAVELAQAGQVSGLVTNPIHKAVMYEGGFRFPGHTEYLAHLARLDGEQVMMLACPGLRVVPVTVHVGLAQAIRDLTGDAIISVGRTTHRALRTDFALAAPRLAVAALNPHGGEDGTMGREELDIIIPAVEVLRRDGIDIRGPQPADTLFHPVARDSYDAVLCMYHDQALIPLKTIDFAGGVNITLGLPFIRTSPDHGTAFALAGTGRADPSSLLQALATASQIATNRHAAAPHHD